MLDKNYIKLSVYEHLIFLDGIIKGEKEVVDITCSNLQDKELYIQNVKKFLVNEKVLFNGIKDLIIKRTYE